MLTITRRQARSLRGIYRRNVLGLPRGGPSPPLLLSTEGAILRAHYRHGRLGVDYEGPQPSGPAATVAIPLDILAEFEGADDTSVTLEPLSDGRASARWIDGGVPRERAYAVEQADAVPIEGPDLWTELPAEFLDALAEAVRVAGDSGRYALDCIRLGGESGRVVATDGRQLFIASGFALPWRDELPIDATPALGAAALPRDRPVRVGRTATRVVLRAGPWTIGAEIRADARYPDVDAVIPATSGAETAIRLDESDARALAPALGRLPVSDDEYRPVTLECDGEIAVRARSDEHSAVTELVLGSSSYSGPPVALCTDRRLLARALGLGPGTLSIVDPARPVVFRGDRRLYAWQPLGPDGVAPRDDHAARVVLGEHGPPATPPEGPVPRLRVLPISVREPGSVPAPRRNPMPDNRPTPDHVVRFEPSPALKCDPASLIAEAEALHASLAETKASAARLIAGLRRHRKQSRLVSETLKSLRQLKLAEAVD